MFREAATENQHTNVAEYAKSVSAYIQKCMEDVSGTKTVTTWANQKPWMTNELAHTLTDIFNTSLTHAVVPSCFKTANIIPFQKNPTISPLNDYRPVALTLIMMNCFERLVKNHIISKLPLLLIRSSLLTAPTVPQRTLSSPHST